MITFIVIGRNTERTIELCLKSVFNFIAVEKIEGSEVIYVDSDSTDRSVELARNTEAKVIVVTGEVNAAVGRNVGAEHAKGDILFFIDSDMELIPGFLPEMLNDSGALKYPFCTGYWNEVYYNRHWNKQNEELAKPFSEAQFLVVTGGLMIIAKKNWDSIGGMDARFKRSQDHDFGLRMNKAGLPVKKLPVVMVNHHTISYFEGARLGQFFSGTGLLSQGLLMRKHGMDPAYLKRYFAKALYAIWFLASVMLIFVDLNISFILFLSYLAVHALRAIRSGGGLRQIFGTFIFHSLFSAYAGMGFLFYHPSKPVIQVAADSEKPDQNNLVSKDSDNDHQSQS